MKEKVSLPDLREGTGLMPQHLPQDHIKPFTELLIETIDEFRRPDAPDFRPAFLTYSEWVKSMVINFNQDNSNGTVDILPKWGGARLDALIMSK